MMELLGDQTTFLIILPAFSLNISTEASFFFLDGVLFLIDMALLVRRPLIDFALHINIHELNAVLFGWLR